MSNARELGRIKRHQRIRKKIFGTQARPRLSIHRSLKNLYIQLIDDTQGKTLFSSSTLSKEFSKKISKATKVEKSAKLGEIFGKAMKEKGFEKISFDRGGYLYHGRIKALADSLRQAGIQF